jgi:glycolate oxidase FAD binding subunit
MIEGSVSDQYVLVSAGTPRLEVYAALPAGLYPPFSPVELPGGVGGVVSRGGFAQTFFFGAEVLGLTFVTPRGRRVVAGGRTIKSVQGYDLTRPFVGSFGALGQAETVTPRLWPGLAAAHRRKAGTLEDVPESRARYLWQDSETLHAYHFGHVREVQRVMEQFGGEAVKDRLDYRPRYPGGLGVGTGDLRDRRFSWVTYPMPKGRGFSGDDMRYSAIVTT